MTTSSAPSISDHVVDQADTEWVLDVSIDTSGRVTAAGVPFWQQGPYAVYVEGLLHDRDDLAALAGREATCAGAELVCGAYERRGDAMLEQLRGSFAVVIVDRVRNVVIAARDPIGSHPLFYVSIGGRVRLSPSQLTLIGQPGVSAALNRLALADSLCQRWPAVEETYFEAVKRVPPGCCLRFDVKGMRVDRHWNRLTDPIHFLSEAEADRFDEQLARAVSRCFDAGRVGIFLSGGFDSVSVAAVAADHARRSGQPDPVALSLVFPHPECNEQPVQVSVARKLGLPHELLGFTEAAGPNGSLGQCLELNRRTSAPLFNTWIPSYLTLAARGRMHGVRTIVTGEGGDEWLNVSPYISADLIARGDFAGAVRIARAWHRGFDAGWRAIARQALWTFGARPWIGAACSMVAGRAWDRNRAARLTRDDPSWVAPDPDLRRQQKGRLINLVPEARPRSGFYAREMRTFLTDPLMPTFFEEQHELGRSYGVRYQHPYWDADLVEHMYRTPPAVLTRGGRTKALVRSAVDRRFPGLGFGNQRKVIASSFFSSLASPDLPRLAREFWDFRALGSLGVVEPAAARAFVQSAPGGSPRTVFHAWRTIALEAWAQGRINGAAAKGKVI